MNQGGKRSRSVCCLCQQGRQQNSNSADIFLQLRETPFMQFLVSALTSNTDATLQLKYVHLLHWQRLFCLHLKLMAAVCALTDLIETFFSIVVSSKHWETAQQEPLRKQWKEKRRKNQKWLVFTC